MAILSTKTFYYIAKKSTTKEGEKIDPIYFDTLSRVYSPMASYEYATAYTTQQEVKKRVTILNMLAQLETIGDIEVEYITVKKTETIEEIAEEI